jgi:hypothetical protein
MRCEAGRWYGCRDAGRWNSQTRPRNATSVRLGSRSTGARGSGTLIVWSSGEAEEEAMIDASGRPGSRLGPICGAMLLVIVSAACSANSRAPSQAAPTSTLTTRVSSGGEPIVTVVASYAVPGGEADRVTILSHYLAYGGKSSAALSFPEELRVVDLTSGVSRVVGRAPRGGTIDDPVVVDDTIAWLEEEQVITDAQRAVAWRIAAASLTTGKDWTVASSNGRREADVPFLAAGSAILTWQRQGANGDDLFVADATANSAARVVVSGLAGPNLAPHPCHGGLVFSQWLDMHGAPVSHAPSGPDDSTVVSGVSRVDLAGHVSVLTASSHSDAVFSSCDDSHVVWTEPRSGDPQSLWSMSWAAANPVQIAGANHGNAVLAGEFVAYYDADGILVAQRAIPGAAVKHVEASPHIPARTASDGGRIAYGVQVGDQARLVVAQLS